MFRAYAADLNAIRDRLTSLCASGGISRSGNVVADWSECCDLLLPSYVHMMNNRLGLSRTEEAYAALLVGRVLELGVGPTGH